MKGVSTLGNNNKIKTIRVAFRESTYLKKNHLLGKCGARAFKKSRHCGIFFLLCGECILLISPCVDHVEKSYTNCRLISKKFLF